MQYFTLTFALLTLFAVGSFAEDVGLLKRLFTGLEMELEKRNEAENCVNAIEDGGDNWTNSQCAELIGLGYCIKFLVRKNCERSCMRCYYELCRDTRADCDTATLNDMCQMSSLVVEGCRKTCKQC
ncbi:unnamed protein product [Owenia fusiformis]|uniref:ShKT domain-containing protein n=1 Tax=Owenia fusiformis TaxID=6347 RepID=A0A8S4NHJ4_OWEFU|nr:unnamed protein product [Owenia fusiformis]